MKLKRTSLKKKLKVLLFYILSFSVITYFTGFRAGTLSSFIIGFFLIYFFSGKDKKSKSDELMKKGDFIKPEKLNYEDN